MKYKVVIVENPPPDFEPKYFDSEATYSSKRGELFFNDEIKLESRKSYPGWFLTLALLLIGISTGASFLFLPMLILTGIFIVGAVVALIKMRKKEITIINYKEIKSLSLHEYPRGLLKIKALVINLKTNSKNLWISADKKTEDLYNFLKEKIHSEQRITP